MDKSKVLVIGHRGAAGVAPENTLGSFQLAVRQGSDAIELDVHPSRDGEIVVCHDHTLDRTTGSTGSIKELSFAEISQADAGSWFSSSFAGERIPSLEEVFELVSKEVEVNVEIKEDSEELRSNLIQLLRSRGLMNRVFVSSFNHRCLIELKKAAPEIRIGLLYKDDYIAPSDVKTRFDAEIYSLHPHHSFVDEAFMQDARSNNLQVYPWTVNNKERMLELIEVGVSGIITDYPAVLRELLDQAEA